jgi:hypothetical protein
MKKKYTLLINKIIQMMHAQFVIDNILVETVVQKAKPMHIAVKQDISVNTSHVHLNVAFQKA